jgi:organic radical activating enzyme
MRPSLIHSRDERAQQQQASAERFDVQEPTKRLRQPVDELPGQSIEPRIRLLVQVHRYWWGTPPRRP